MSVWFRVALLAFGLCVTQVHAIEIDLTVKGSGHDAKQVPLRVPLSIDVAESTAVSLSGDGFNIIGQISRTGVLGDEGMELTFVMPAINADEEIKLVAKSISANETPKRFQYHDESGKHRELKFGDRPVMRYMYEAIDRSSPERIGETYKVFHHVYDPSGSRYVTKGAGGLFPHHRGLFFGFNRISYGDNKQADVWHCNKGERQNHREFASHETGSAFGRELLKVDWHGRDDKVFAEESREMTAYNTEGGVLIEFASVLESKVGKIRLDGDPQHAGFQFRASQDVPDKTKDQTYYVRPDGKGEPGKFRNWSNKAEETKENLAHINLPFNALSFVIDGQRFTCCYLDHPQNPKPARFSERDYGRFGSYFEYDMDTEKPLRLNYRIWLQTGEMTVEEVAQMSHGFVSPPTVSVDIRN